MQTELNQPKTRRENEIWQACDALLVELGTSRSITGDAIRDQLLKMGMKRGSPNEIYRYRATWKESRGVQDDASEDAAPMADPIFSAVSLVYDQIRKKGQEELEAVQSDMQAANDALNEQLVAAQNALNDERAQHEQTAAQLQELVALHEALQKAHKAIEQQNIFLLSENKDMRQKLEAQQKEHERLLLEIKGFHEKEVDLLREQQQAVIRGYEREASVLLEQLKQQGHALSEDLNLLKVELRQRDDLLSKAHRSLTQCETRLENAESQMNALKSELAAAQEHSASLSLKHAQAESALALQKQYNEHMQKERLQQDGLLASLLESIQSLKQQTKKAQRRHQPTASDDAKSA